MKQTVSVSDFRDSFTKMNRQNNFSYEGLGVLFNYFEELEESTDTEIELDVIAICCDYTECDIQEAREMYSHISEDYPIDDDFIRALQEYTEVLDVGFDQFIIQDF
jgi:hypothetical protein